MPVSVSVYLYLSANVGAAHIQYTYCFVTYTLGHIAHIAVSYNQCAGFHHTSHYSRQSIEVNSKNM